MKKTDREQRRAGEGGRAGGGEGYTNKYFGITLTRCYIQEENNDKMKIFMQQRGQQCNQRPFCSIPI